MVVLVVVVVVVVPTTCTHHTRAHTHAPHVISSDIKAYRLLLE